MAAAYAETGDFEQAVKYQLQAIAGTTGDAAKKKGKEDRLALYRQRKPYRQELELIAR